MTGRMCRVHGTSRYSFRLKSATADLRDASGDDRLDSVLAEIELRLEVEIAKMGPPRWGQSGVETPRFF